MGGFSARSVIPSSIGGITLWRGPARSIYYMHYVILRSIKIMDYNDLCLAIMVLT